MLFFFVEITWYLMANVILFTQPLVSFHFLPFVDTPLIPDGYINFLYSLKSTRKCFSTFATQFNDRQSSFPSCFLRVVFWFLFLSLKSKIKLFFYFPLLHEKSMKSYYEKSRKLLHLLKSQVSKKKQSQGFSVSTNSLAIYKQNGRGKKLIKMKIILLATFLKTI